jgi:phytoene synthase
MTDSTISGPLAASRQACRKMTQQHATTFYFASHTLPVEKRADAYAVYAFCRYVDDEIDLAPNATVRKTSFQGLREILGLVYGGTSETRTEAEARLPWLMAFHETAMRRQIPLTYFQDLLTGVEGDQGTVRIANWPELELYCYRVASVVGLIMTHVLTQPQPHLLPPAKDLGTAMQLTNILRDIAEDWENDRIYLPVDELNKFGLRVEDIAAKRVNDSFRAMMRFQIGRARQYYKQAEVGIRELPQDGSQLTVRLMSTIYGGILDEIERADYQVFNGRVRVSTLRKVRLATQVWLRGNRPEARGKVAG